MSATTALVWALFVLTVGPRTARAEADAKPPKVAVLELHTAGTEAPLAATLTGVLLSGLAEGGGLELLSNADLRNILTLEEIKQLIGCPPEDPDCVLDRGHSLGGANLIWGTVGKVGDRIVISVAAVDTEARTTLGRSSRTTAADDGDALIEATAEIAAEMRAALGLESEATWEPLVGISLRFGGVLGGYLADSGQPPDALLAAFELEFDVYLFSSVPIFLTIGLTLGGGDNDIVLVPGTLGVKYRAIGAVVTPYGGIGFGLGFLDFSGSGGGAFTVHLLGGLEINPYKRFGITLEGGVDFSQTFNTANFTRLAGSLHLGVVYRF